MTVFFLNLSKMIRASARKRTVFFGCHEAALSTHSLSQSIKTIGESLEPSVASKLRHFNFLPSRVTILRSPLT